jgi:hypothetical protein
VRHGFVATVVVVTAVVATVVVDEAEVLVALEFELGVELTPALRTHFNVFPDLLQEKRTPFTMREVPTFEHLVPTI